MAIFDWFLSKIHQKKNKVFFIKKIIRFQKMNFNNCSIF